MLPFKNDNLITLQVCIFNHVFLKVVYESIYMKSIYRKDITITKTEKWLTGKGWGRGDIVELFFPLIPILRSTKSIPKGKAPSCPE